MISGEQANGNSTMEAWDENLVQYGSEIIEKRCSLLAGIREKFVKYMNYFFPGIQADIFYIFSWDRSIQGAPINLDNPINLQSSTILQSGTIKDIFNTKLKQGFKKDLLLKTTLVGPHRDDLLITINGKDIRSFGSQGQQRIAAVCFKFGELEVLREMLNKNPILLLDDVLSELDPERKKLLVNIIGANSQTFITTSNLVSLSDIGEKFIDKLLVKENNIFF